MSLVSAPLVYAMHRLILAVGSLRSGFRWGNNSQFLAYVFAYEKPYVFDKNLFLCQFVAWFLASELCTLFSLLCSTFRLHSASFLRKKSKSWRQRLKMNWYKPTLGYFTILVKDFLKLFSSACFSGEKLVKTFNMSTFPLAQPHRLRRSHHALP